LILSDWDIRVYLEKKLLVIDPLFEDTVRENGVDLRFGKVFCRFRKSGHIIDTLRQGINDFLECFEANDEGFVINPLEHILATTLEYVELPHDLVGLVNLRSTFARYGLYIPPCFHPDSWLLGNGGIPIKAGEAESVFDPFTGEWSTRKVVMEYQGEMVNVYIDDIPEIVTPNHKYLVFDETKSPPYDEKPAALLKPGDLVAVMRSPILKNDDLLLLPHGSARVRISDELADVIRDKVEQENLSLTKLAHTLGRSRSYVRNLINGNYGVRFNELNKMLEILGINILDVIDHIDISGFRDERIPAKNYTRKVSDVASFIGYYVGDGNSLKRYRFPVATGSDEERLTHYGEIALKLFNAPFDIKRQGDEYVLYIKSRILRDWMFEHFREGVAVYQREKRIPRTISQSSNLAISRFLSGLFDADGYSGKTEDVVLYTVSRELAIETKLLLTRLGIYASVYVKPCSRCHEGKIYAVRVDGLTSRRILRAWINNSQKSLKQLPGKETVDLIPLSLHAKKVLSSLPRDDEEMYRTLQNYIRRGRIPISEIAFVNSKLRHYKPVGWEKAINDIMSAARFRWVKVKKIETSMYEGPIIDWETRSHWHLSYATITHNTVIDSGFKGNITIELIGSTIPVRVYPKQRFLHVVLLRTSSPVYKPYAGKYQGQRGVTPPRPDELR